MIHLKLFTHNDVYKPTYKLYQYGDHSFRLCYLKNAKQPGFEEVKSNKGKIFDENYIPQTDSDEIIRISLSRSRRNIKEICLCNDFDYFATWTMNSSTCDRFNLEICQEHMKKVCHKIKRKHKDFKFVFITEKHQNGAFHFHGFVKNIPNLYENQNGFLSCKDFDLLGFNSFLKIDKSQPNNYEKCCNYMTKYITKDTVKSYRNQVYFCSRGLHKADVTTLKFEQAEKLLKDFSYSYENDFCKLFDFNILDENIDKNLILKLFSID